MNQKVTAADPHRWPLARSISIGFTANIAADCDTTVWTIATGRRRDSSDEPAADATLIRDALVYASGLTGVALFGRPIPRHEVVEAGHFVLCDAREHPAKPSFRFDVVHAAGFDERVCDGGSIAAAL